jgi:hypothetical protein
LLSLGKGREKSTPLKYLISKTLIILVSFIYLREINKYLKIMTRGVKPKRINTSLRNNN